MADDDPPKPSIPSWQRVTKASAPVESTKDESNPDEPTKEVDDSPEELLSGPGSAPSVSYQLDQIESFLEEPVIKAAPVEKKRAFLESKAVPKATIDTYLPATPADNVNFDDFKSFQQSQPPSASTTESNPTPAPVSAPATVSPPIITYPEFLVEARRPPPLITPQRILNAGYLAGGIAAMLYGASQYLITPMVESLTVARQDFAVHNRSKIDEFNERLSKIVSKVPEKAKSTEQAAGPGDVESETSEPTELFSRDMGTQTTPPSSRRSSLSEVVEKRTPTDVHAETLEKIKAIITQAADAIEHNGEGQKEREESFQKLQTVVDNLLFATPAVNLWTQAEDSSVTKTANTRDDVVEQLKKEIRGVKGLLLNARRFPSTPSMRVGA